MELNELVKKYRRQKGLTQSKLAEKANISERTVSRAESGVNVSRGLLLTLARALEIPEAEMRAPDSKQTTGSPATGHSEDTFDSTPDGPAVLTIAGERIEIEDDEELPARPRTYTFANGIQIARFITSFEPRIRVEHPAESAERQASLKRFVRCAESLRDDWRALTDYGLFEIEQQLHGAYEEVTAPADSENPTIGWWVHATTAVTKRVGGDGKAYDVVEAVLMIDYCDIPF